MRTLFHWGLIASLAALCLIKPVAAEDYPMRPVMLIVPMGPGGPLDLTARLLAAKLWASLGKTFVVENRPGGGTIIGAMAVAKAEPDGYTLLIAPNSTVTTNVTVFKKLPYDPQKDFTPISMLASTPLLLVANPAG